MCFDQFQHTHTHTHTHTQTQTHIKTHNIQGDHSNIKKEQKKCLKSG
jgi:hypothetical protein